MIRKLGLVFTLCLVVCYGSCVSVRSKPKRESHAKKQALYEGKTYSQWLMVFKSNSPYAFKKGVTVFYRIGTPAVPTLISALKHQNWKLRRGAAEALGRLGSDAYKAIPALIRVLGDKHDDVRRHARPALHSIGSKSIPHVIKALSSKNRYRCRYAIYTLGSFGVEASKAIPTLLKALRAPHPKIRRAAQYALGEMRHEALPSVLALLQNKRSSLRIAALVILSHMVHNTKISLRTIKEHKVISALLKALKDPHPNARSSAVYTLQKIDELDNTYRPNDPLTLAVAKRLRDKHASVRKAALWAISRMGLRGPKHTSILPALLPFLHSKSYETRGKTLYILSLLDASARRQTIPIMYRMLQDKHEYVRREAIGALGRCLVSSKKVIVTVAAMLEDPNKNVRYQVLSFLEGLASQKKAQPWVYPYLAKSLKNAPWQIRLSIARLLWSYDAVVNLVVQDLSNALKDKNEWVRKAAAVSLGKVGFKAHKALPHLHRLLKDKSQQVRKAVVLAVGKMGIKAERSAPALMQLWGDAHSDLRKAATLSLGRLGTKSHYVFSLLLKTLQSQDWRRRMYAAQTLRRTKVQKNRVVSALLKLQKDKKWQVREAIFRALGTTGGKSPLVVPLLIKKLKAQKKDIGAAAATSLGELGAKAVKAIPALGHAISVDDGNVAIPALFALSKIGMYTSTDKCVQILIRALSRRSVYLQMAAAKAIRAMGTKAYKAVPALAKTITNSVVEDPVGYQTDLQRELRFACVRTLEVMGRKALGASSALVWAFRDRGRGLWWAISKTFRAIGPKAIPTLLKGIHSRNEHVRFGSARALGRFGKKSSLGLLRELSSADETRRYRTIIAIGHSRLKSRLFLVPLKKCLSDKNPKVRMAAKKVLQYLRH